MKLIDKYTDAARTTFTETRFLMIPGDDVRAVIAELDNAHLRRTIISFSSSHSVIAVELPVPSVALAVKVTEAAVAWNDAEQKQAEDTSNQAMFMKMVIAFENFKTSRDAYRAAKVVK